MTSQNKTEFRAGVSNIKTSSKERRRKNKRRVDARLLQHSQSI
jgi:hypothetical protein